MRSVLLFVLVLAALSGCSSLLKVYSEEQPGVNLAQYYSYDWLENNEPQPGDPASYPLSRHVADKIRSATDAQMKLSGYQRSEVAPELRLHYHVVVENQVYYQHEWRCNEPEDLRIGNCHPIQPVHFREGTLIIDFMDAKTGQQVWRGVAVGIVEHYTPAEWDAQIEEAIRRIFKKFPIQPRASRQAGRLAK